MSSRLRIILMWLLVAALPVQGWAAAAMVHCGPSHHEMATTSNDTLHAAMGHHEHDEHHEHHAAGADVPADTEHQPAQALGKLKCSACASCCLGLALPSAVMPFDAGVASSRLEPVLPTAVAVFLTGGPERPPRPLLA